MLSDREREEGLRLLAAATQGEWMWQRPQINEWVGEDGETPSNVDHEHDEDEYEALVVGPLHRQDREDVIGYFRCGSHHLRVSPADAALIAWLRNNAAALLGKSADETGASR